MARGTRERLLDIGLDQFAREGLAATTITDLESKAGLRPGSGSFYRHFASKEALFLAVVERELDRLQAAFEESFLGDDVIDDPRAIVTIECRRVLTAMARRDKLTAIIIRDHQALGPLLERIHKTTMRGMDVSADLLAHLMDAGRIPRRDPRPLSAVMTNALIGYHGASQYMKAPSGDVDEADFIASLVDLVVT